MDGLPAVFRLHPVSQATSDHGRPGSRSWNDGSRSEPGVNPPASLPALAGFVQLELPLSRQ
jgi:hypothetical protein